MTMMGEHGQGTITRRKDGRLQVAVTMPDGHRTYRMVGRDSDPKRQQRKAEGVRRDLLRRRDVDLHPSSQTLAVFLRSWLRGLRDVPNPRIRPRTYQHYEMVVEKHVIPALGGRRLEDLSPRHVQAWLDADAAHPQTVHHHRAVLRRALNVAKRQRLIDYNPAADVELPRVPRFEGAPLTAGEAERLLETTRDDRLGILWRLAIITGLRESELLGLAWENVDLATGRLRIVNQLARVDGGWYFVPPKVARKVATIAVDPETSALLGVHQRRQAAERRPEWPYWGLVFVTPAGMPFYAQDIRRAWQAACDKAGIARRRFHDLRVTAATLMAEEGIEEATRMARLGHATTRVNRHYTVVREQLDRDAAERIAKAIGG
jgi:integrase